ncbi:MAG: metallophosphoesterase [Xenococcaceae cyanobacterium MO_188.B29]|nr:metallophosphoesterase [Xenococcaceae cyanobacterium MO_188.B29]
MTSFNLLHLTDFHQGMKEQEHLWPSVKDKFLRDLDSLSEQCGEWDIVLFTGDLTQRATAEEFKKVDEFLTEMWEHFQQPQPPILLAVPGNHDLVRPRQDAQLNLLDKFPENPTVRNIFWNQENSDHRQLVSQVFTNYTQWWEKQLDKFQDIQLGMLPGDFSYSLKKDDISLGIIGLNTSFLQLASGRDYKGKLALNIRQFNAVCEQNALNWANQHSVCLLLTHHPPSWLMRDSDLDEATIPDYIQFHLCGHLHESHSQLLSQNGGKSQLTIQGRSLFGLEKVGDGIDRSHGYSAIKIELSENERKLIIWPRASYRQGNFRKILPDYAFNLHKGIDKEIVESIIEQNKQLESWKGIHKSVQQLSNQLISLRFEINSSNLKTLPGMMIKSVVEKWGLDKNQEGLDPKKNTLETCMTYKDLILYITELDNIDSEEVKRKIERSDFFDKINYKSTSVNDNVKKFYDSLNMYIHFKNKHSTQSGQNHSTNSLETQKDYFKRLEECAKDLLSYLQELEKIISNYLTYIDLEMQNLITAFQENFIELEKLLKLSDSYEHPL